MTSILNRALADRHAGNPNLIVDGDFRFWFEGTSQTTSGYGSDTMWANIDSSGTKTASRQSFALGQSEVPTLSGYFSRTEFTEPGTKADGDYCAKSHKIEGVDTLEGKTATLSFWAKADAARDVAISFTQNFGSGGTPSESTGFINKGTVTLGTAWKKFVHTIEVPSISGKTLGTDNNDHLRLYFWFFTGSTLDASSSSNLGYQSGTVDIAHVKLEEGPVATEGGWRNEAEELALVNRYFYEREGTFYGFMARSDDDFRSWDLEFPVVMRAAPSIAVVGNGNPSVIGDPASTDVTFNDSVGNTTSTRIITSVIADARL